MASNAAKECGVCNEEFDEDDRIPRCLPCIHCICSDCIEQLIARNKKACPFCRQRFEARRARDFGVNTGLIEVLTLLRDMEKKTLATTASAADTSKWRDEFRRENKHIANQNIDFCREAQKQIDIDINMNNDILNSLLHDNRIIKNEIVVLVNDMVNENECQANYLKEQNRRLETQKKEVREREKQSEQVIRKLADTNSSTHTAIIFNEVEDANSDVKTWIHSFNHFNTGERNARNAIEKVSKNMTDKVQILREVLNSAPEEVEEVDLIADLGLITFEGSPNVTLESLRTKTESVMKMLRQGRVFALQESRGKRRCARISVGEKNRICLHYLKEETLRPGSCSLKHSDIMTMVDSSSRLTFLEFSNVSQEKLGRLYIRLSSKTKRTNQFCLMCTGEAGPSYANTKTIQVTWKNKDKEFIVFGDYEYQDGTGGKALVTGVCEEKTFQNAWLQGAVSGGFPSLGKERATQFYIVTKSILGMQLPWSFGVVEEGLQVLTDAIKRHCNIKDVLISDCGLVLEI